MITEIKKGDRFRCVRDVAMNTDENIAFNKGREYVSEQDNCITNNEGETNHWWTEKDQANLYFTKIDPDTQQDLNREVIEQDEVERSTTAQINWNNEYINPMTGRRRDDPNEIEWAKKWEPTENEFNATSKILESTPTPDISIGSRQFDTGSKRDNDDDKPLPMEMNPYMLMRYGYHMKYGQLRYGDGNWELQQPDIEIWRSMSRHFMQAYMNFKFPEQAKATDDGTDHLSALIFGINMLMHNECSKGVEADMYFKRRNK